MVLVPLPEGNGASRLITSPEKEKSDEAAS